jgi:hypothetical protein
LRWISICTADKDYAQSIDDIASWTSVGVILAIPTLLTLCVLQLVVLVCVRSKRMAERSWTTLGVEEFVKSTQRILLNDELEGLLDVEEEETATAASPEKPRMARQ